MSYFVSQLISCDDIVHYDHPLAVINDYYDTVTHHLCVIKGNGYPTVISVMNNNIVTE